MGVYKEGKNWKVQVYYKDWQGNRKRKQKRGFRTKGEAKEWERDFLQQQSQGVDIEFGNFLEIYYKDMDVRLRENTMYTKRYIIDLKIKGRSASKIKLTSYDELLGGGEETNDIQQVSLEHLHSFENHPFQVNDDEAMAELVESVKEEGILTALLVRPLGDGEYEIIAGHRRRHAAQLAGLKEVPVIIRNMDQDTAVRAMVDSNLQRPNILPSEKAFAYRMKMEAMNHQGTSGGISAKDIGKNANDSARQVYRYIRLTYLMNDLLNAVDRDVIGLQVGVELSYLTVPEQEMVEEVHESTGKYPSLEQAKKIRQHREEKTLTKEIVRLLVIGERKKKTTVTLKQDEIKKYFPPEYDEQKIRTVICQLLEEWSNQNH